MVKQSRRSLRFHPFLRALLPASCCSRVVLCSPAQLQHLLGDFLHLAPLVDIGFCVFLFLSFLLHVGGSIDCVVAFWEKGMSEVYFILIFNL